MIPDPVTGRLLRALAVAAWLACAAVALAGSACDRPREAGAVPAELVIAPAAALSSP